MQNRSLFNPAAWVPNETCLRMALLVLCCVGLAAATNERMSPRAPHFASASRLQTGKASRLTLICIMAHQCSLVLLLLDLYQVFWCAFEMTAMKSFLHLKKSFRGMYDGCHIISHILLSTSNASSLFNEINLIIMVVGFEHHLTSFSQDKSSYPFP